MHRLASCVDCAEKVKAMTKLFRAIGLMSGTSMDGIDLAFIETDGENFVKPLGASETNYDAAQRSKLRAALQAAATWEPEASMPDAVVDAERLITGAHADAILSFMQKQGLQEKDIDLIGFHGQTVLHQPDRRRTVQIGSGARLAELTGIDVVNDFRSADVAAGGEGAPFAPLYHKALAASATLPGLVKTTPSWRSIPVPPMALSTIGFTRRVRAAWIWMAQSLPEGRLTRPYWRRC